MGCCFSAVQPDEMSSHFPSVGSGDKSLSYASVTVEWKVMMSIKDARRKFVANGTLGPNCSDSYVALRIMLDEHSSRQALGQYAVAMKRWPPLMFWFDVEEFKTIFTESYRYSTALDIYYTYLKKDESTFLLEFISDEARQHIEDDLKFVEGDSSLLTSQFYDVVQSAALDYIHEHIFVPFKDTDMYTDLNRRLDKRYNRVKVTDFDYFGKLGEGGFGYVVHCRKKSTGEHYAMKIQRKIDLIKSAGKNPDNVCLEKQAFAACQYPFIVSMAYSFQTDNLAIMVLDLSMAGDLQQALNRSPQCKFDEASARFYIAEVTLAVEYLHQLGYIYRDLKPNNGMSWSGRVWFGYCMQPTGAYRTAFSSNILSLVCYVLHRLSCPHHVFCVCITSSSCCFVLCSSDGRRWTHSFARFGRLCCDYFLRHQREQERWLAAGCCPKQKDGHQAQALFRPPQKPQEWDRLHHF
jgi:hypothetical protein